MVAAGFFDFLSSRHFCDFFDRDWFPILFVPGGDWIRLGHHRRWWRAVVDQQAT